MVTTVVAAVLFAVVLAGLALLFISPDPQTSHARHANESTAAEQAIADAAKAADAARVAAIKSQQGH